MNSILNAIHRFLFWITFGPFRDKRNKVRRRANYEFLKANISQRHFDGFAGLVVDFKGKSFDKYDLGCFTAPMYYMVKNADDKWCIFWDRKRLAREIGTGAPLKEGEVLLPDTLGRTKPQETIDTINNQEPLTHQEKTPTDGTPPETV